MPAYLLANITVTDPDRYQSYREQVGPVVAQYGGRFLVRAGKVHPLEGEFGLDRCVVLEFPSMEAAQRFYHSPEYAPLLSLRIAATQSKVVFVEGVPPA
jgi:uncharacterized protein (DUF1330 family)